MKRSKRAALALTGLLLLALAGCATSGSLYALPQLSDEYIQLESLIAQRIRDGDEYAAPVGGSSRQSVQMHDLDGDGDAEAVAFLADSTHTPTVCVYRRSDAGDYYLDVIISGEGYAVSSVEYADLTGDGAEEIVIAWQISGDIRLLSVYSLAGEEPTALLSADCSESYVCDLDGDGTDELLVLRQDGGTGRLLRYAFTRAGERSTSEAPLSPDAGELLRIRTGSLSDGTTALFVECRTGTDEALTDVFTAPDGTLGSLSVGADTVRTDAVYAEDINGDRATEVPAAAGDCLRWSSLDASGRSAHVMTTYHDCEDGWYLVLPARYDPEGIAVTREDTAPGETAVTFTLPSGGAGALATVYTLTGENRLDRAQDEARFVLAQNETTVYAAELPADGALSQQEIQEGFNLIYPEWQM